MHECEIGAQLEMVHKWIHKVCEHLSKAEIAQAEVVGHAILNLLNDGAGAGMSNGIKLLAVFDAMISGAEHMEENTVPVPEGPSTIQ